MSYPIGYADICCNTGYVYPLDGSLHKTQLCECVYIYTYVIIYVHICIYIDKHSIDVIDVNTIPPLHPMNNGY